MHETITPDICAGEFSTKSTPTVTIPELTLKPRTGRIAVVSCHPARLAEIRQQTSSGVLWVPENSDTQPLPGIVVGVGEGVRGVAFGDAVMLPSWDRQGVVWFRSPFLHLGGVYGAHAAGVYRDHRGGELDSVLARGDDKLVFLNSTSDILWKIVPGEGTGPAGDMQAVGERVIARFRPMREETEAGIATPNYIRDTPSVAQVLSINMKTAMKYDIHERDWILVPRFTGTRVTYHDLGEEWVSLLARDVCAAWDHEPGDAQWVK